MMDEIKILLPNCQTNIEIEEDFGSLEFGLCEGEIAICRLKFAVCNLQIAKLIFQFGDFCLRIGV